MKRIALTFAAGAVILTSGITAASSQQRSTFQDSCTNIRYAQDGDNAMIAADCRRRDGTIMATSVVIKGIDNQEGELKHTAGNVPSSFQRSCENMRIEMGGPSGVTLAGRCRTTPGELRDATTAIWDLNNTDGTLQYPY